MDFADEPLAQLAAYGGDRPTLRTLVGQLQIEA
jgi:hypothetical protein